MRREVALAALACALAAPAAAEAQEAARPEAQPEREREAAAEPQGDWRPSFVPPARGAPRQRVGGATRGARPEGEPLPELEVLTPEHAGLTLEESPTLYWYLSKPTRQRIDFTLTELNAVRPLLEKTLPGPFDAGVQRIELAGLGVRLAPGKTYLWYVALVPDPEQRSSDLVAGGGVERLADPAPVQSALAGAPQGRAVFVLAERGIWYDAIDLLSREIERAPSDPLPRAQRAALLEQVGLERVAAAVRPAR